VDGLFVSSLGFPSRLNTLLKSLEPVKGLGKKAKLDELASQTNEAASAKFLPTRSGNVAQSIEIGQ